MNALRIDFAPPSIKRSLWRAGPMLWLAIAAGLLVCAAGAITAFNLLEQRSTLQRERLRLQAKITEHIARQPTPKAFSIPDAQAEAVNRATAQLNIPWRDLFNTVEAATPESIALLSIEPDARKHALRGIAEAKSSESMISYIELLKRQDFFNDVLLTKHEVNEQDPNKPLRFQFEVKWNEVGR